MTSEHRNRSNQTKAFFHVSLAAGYVFRVFEEIPAGAHQERIRAVLKPGYYTGNELGTYKESGGRERMEIIARKACRILQKRVKSIQSVGDWVKATRCSRSWFCTVMQSCYGKSPKLLLREYRYGVVVNGIVNHPQASSDFIADEAGLKTAQGLYKFLSKHYDTNFSGLRTEVLGLQLQEEIPRNSLY